MIAAILFATVIASSTNVAELEKIARTGSKDERPQAYARLGELGTDESLRAVERIERDAKRWRASDPLTLGDFPHPGWHMNDNEISAQWSARQNGINYAVIIDYVFGDMDLLLLSQNADGSWSRPHLVPLKLYRGMQNLALKAGAGGTLIFSFDQQPPPERRIMEGTRDPGEQAPVLGHRELLIDPAKVLRDSDRDGLTDAEEERLGLSPSNRDSDGDGIADGDDTAPDFAPNKTTEEDLILQRAVFATFCIGGARYTMFAAPDVRRIQPLGSRGFVIYNKHPRGYGAVSVRWKIAQKSDAAAVVELSDSEGPLAAGGVNVTLARKHGTWYVVRVQTTWIS